MSTLGSCLTGLMFDLSDCFSTGFSARRSDEEKASETHSAAVDANAPQGVLCVVELRDAILHSFPHGHLHVVHGCVSCRLHRFRRA